MNIFRFFFKGKRCSHVYRPKGWSFAKCRLCGNITQDETKVARALEDMQNAREKGMREAGFSDEQIKEVLPLE